MFEVELMYNPLFERVLLGALSMAVSEGVRFTNVVVLAARLMVKSTPDALAGWRTRMVAGELNVCNCKPTGDCGKTVGVDGAANQNDVSIWATNPLKKCNKNKACKSVLTLIG